MAIRAVKRVALHTMVFLGACGGGDGGRTDADTETDADAVPFFQSGFEDGVTAQETGTAKCSGDIQGADGREHGDWVADLEAPPMDSAGFCYGGADDYALEGEDLGQRGIELVADPDDPDNRVLHTWVREPAENYDGKDLDDQACSCEGGVDAGGQPCTDNPRGDGHDDNGTRKARVQLAIHAAEGSSLGSFSYSVRLRLGEGFALLNGQTDLELDWMTIGEFWSQGPAGAGVGDRARVTLNLVKEPGGVFEFGLKADTQPDGGSGWDWLWPASGHLDSGVEAPIGEWFTLDVRLVAGDAETGRVTVDLEREDGERMNLFDVTGATVFPGGQVQGFTTLNPIKLYTGGNVVCGLRQAGSLLDAHWDDFTLEVGDDE